MKTSNKHVAVIAQIESVKGIANVDEIASIPGVSALMFGPGDFMADAGLELTLGQPHPTLAAAMESMSKASKKHNVPLFGYVHLFSIHTIIYAQTNMLYGIAQQ